MIKKRSILADRIALLKMGIIAHSKRKGLYTFCWYLPPNQRDQVLLIASNKNQINQGTVLQLGTYPIDNIRKNRKLISALTQITELNEDDARRLAKIIQRTSQLDRRLFKIAGMIKRRTTRNQRTIE